MNENSRGYKILEMAASNKVAEEKQSKYSVKFMPCQRRDSRRGQVLPHL